MKSEDNGRKIVISNNENLTDVGFLSRWLDENEIKQIYVYGAGIVSYYFSNWLLRESNTQILGYIVSDKNNTLFSDYFGIPVESIDDISPREEYGVVVATMPNLHNEIKATLIEKGFSKCLFCSEKLYREIRGEFPSSDAEILRLEQIIFSNQKKLYNETIKISANVNYIKSIVDRMYCPYTGYDFDQKMYLNDYLFWIEDKEQSEEELKKLIHNLDDSSREEVLRALSRMRTLSKGKIIDYSEEEINELKRVDNEFIKKVYRIRDNHFYYGSFTVEGGKAEQPCFYNEHGISEIIDKEKAFSSDAIDAGGFIGDSALVLSQYTKGIIHSFEADDDNIEVMKRNLMANNLADKVIPVNLALGNTVGEIKLYSGMLGSNSNSIESNGNLVCDDIFKVVQATTIDRYVKDNGLLISLIKTDVEGAEFDLLRGAINTIKTQKPTLLISIYHSLNDFLRIKPWIEELNLGYKFKIFRPVMKGSFLAETILICEANDYE